MTRIVGLRWLSATAVSFVLASLGHSQQVLHGLMAVGVEIDGRTALRFVLGDLAGLSLSYLPVIALALALAFWVTGPLGRRWPAASLWLYSAAGATALLTVLLLMYPILHTTLIAGARGWGLALQVLAGALGGWVFGVWGKGGKRRQRAETNGRGRRPFPGPRATHKKRRLT